jgi:hypothetical protein
LALVLTFAALAVGAYLASPRLGWHVGVSVMVPLLLLAVFMAAWVAGALPARLPERIGVGPARFLFTVVLVYGCFQVLDSPDWLLTPLYHLTGITPGPNDRAVAMGAAGILLLCVLAATVAQAVRRRHRGRPVIARA